MGRDVGRDEGREQAEWRELVARLEFNGPLDPAQAPWPDRENLPARPQQAPTEDSTAEDSAPGNARSEPADIDAEGTGPEDQQSGASDDAPRAADRSRVIKPAGSARSCEPAAEAPPGQAEPTEPDEATLGGPRDYALDEAGENDLGEWDERYVPPPLPPQPGLDPVAKGAWLALFGGPGYLLLATLLGWQIAGWAALMAIVAFVAGFIVLVFRLGGGPSKRDGPDQGAVV